MIPETDYSHALRTFHDQLTAHPHEKRFAEKWVSDAAFRSAFLSDPHGTLDTYGIELDTADVAAFASSGHSPILDRLESLRVAKEQWTQHFYAVQCAPIDPAWIAWRRRQVSRQVFDLGPQHALSNIHSSLTIELSKGCSVGCWFCALSPEKGSTSLRYHEGGRETFAALVAAMKDTLGPAVQSGFLYWATEPMDNPDYELYCKEFYAMVGVFPPTTTAVPHKHPERIRTLLSMASEYHSWLTRFSLLSVSLMHKVHEMFTAEELAVAECLPLNRDTTFAYGVAGRYREFLKDHPELLAEQQRRLQDAPYYDQIREFVSEDTHAHGSIACVTGFLVNIIEQTVQLIAPTHATDEFPVGYITFATARWSNAEDIAGAVADAVRRGRCLHLAADHRCALAPYVTVVVEGEDAVFVGRLGTRIRATNLGSEQDMTKLMMLLRDGSLNRSMVEGGCVGNAAWAATAIDRLWQMGVLVEPTS
jgi:radical SAM family RiPP maturation amino acid epimerase